ncbi:Inner membrane permease YgbN [Posidoniimonas polymericola]|uniref:Inner membrane permease YgbN n=1 Tax=Posidoniimonas polymericola TaxID=2528002 RepID=A0A5C5XUP4_9BACT|nr:GntP family permease [Posidoniimonas polymericola]TWT66987.1 Inner membrane permease YgbN [Posidoniimonas polymericola]
MSPLLVLAIGVAVVLGLILVLRLNAFLALIAAAVTVSFLAPGELTVKVSRVAEAFGTSAGKVGIPIAMAAVIGSCLLASGAADKIVRTALGLVGEKRAGAALAGSGFLLAVPVFFDTVFYLLVPLARSLYNGTRRNYVYYLVAIGTGAVMAHTLVPPTPGPLIVADQLGVDVGLLMLMGTVVSLPALVVGLFSASVMNRVIKLENPPKLEHPAPEESTESLEGPLGGPGLLAAAAPIIVPVVLVASRTILGRLAEGAAPDAAIAQLTQIANVLGDPNLALLIAAAIALAVFVHVRRPGRVELSRLVEESLLSGGLIILITAAGGAFGAMLKAAEIGPAIEQAFAGQAASGQTLLWLAFGVTSLIKVSQGSSTVAMITASAMIGAMIEGEPAAFNPVYLAIAIGCGSSLGVWMNDSGFWIFCRMGGLTESEGLKTWTIQTALMGTVAMIAACILAAFLPLQYVG